MNNEISDQIVGLSTQIMESTPSTPSNLITEIPQLYELINMFSWSSLKGEFAFKLLCIILFMAKQKWCKNPDVFETYITYIQELIKEKTDLTSILEKITHHDRLHHEEHLDGNISIDIFNLYELLKNKQIPDAYALDQLHNLEDKLLPYICNKNVSILKEKLLNYSILKNDQSIKLNHTEHTERRPLIPVIVEYPFHYIKYLILKFNKTL